MVLTLERTVRGDGISVFLLGVLTVEISEGLCIILPLLEDLDYIRNSERIVLFMHPRVVVYLALFV